MIINNYSIKEVRSRASNPNRLAEKIGVPFPDWSHQCHSISLKLVKAGAFGPGRVARGGCKGVGGQHSWIVLGQNVYDPKAIIVDPTLWSYDDQIKGIFATTVAKSRRHRAHGTGSIWEYGRPGECEGDVIWLEGTDDFSRGAKIFLQMLGPLDLKGWITLAHSPVQGWPSGEIIGAMLRHPELKHYIPIDIAGMVTDTNPAGLYLAAE